MFQVTKYTHYTEEDLDTSKPGYHYVKEQGWFYRGTACIAALNVILLLLCFTVKPPQLTIPIPSLRIV